jgi:hypothetical protein
MIWYTTILEIETYNSSSATTIWTKKHKCGAAVYTNEYFPVTKI